MQPERFPQSSYWRHTYGTLFSKFKANVEYQCRNYRKNRSVLAKLHYQNKLLGHDTRHYNWRSCMLVLQFCSFSKVCEKNSKRHLACICLTFAVIYNSKQDTVNNSYHLPLNFDKKSWFSQFFISKMNEKI